MNRMTVPLLLAWSMWAAAVDGDEAVSGLQTDMRTVVVADAVADAVADLLASSCYGCHGTTSGRPGEMPDLSRLSVEDIETRLKAYKQQERPATVMNRIAGGYSDRELEQLAGHFGHPSR